MKAYIQSVLFLAAMLLSAAAMAKGLESFNAELTKAMFSQPSDDTPWQFSEEASYEACSDFNKCGGN